jgi:hypothetical protein
MSLSASRYLLIDNPYRASYATSSLTLLGPVRSCHLLARHRRKGSEAREGNLGTDLHKQREAKTVEAVSVLRRSLRIDD